MIPWTEAERKRSKKKKGRKEGQENRKIESIMKRKWKKGNREGRWKMEDG